jgi:hypothetical protein
MSYRRCRIGCSGVVADENCRSMSVSLPKALTGPGVVNNRSLV